MIHNSIESWIQARDIALKAGKSIGFVPTMGALHEGHLSLLRRARSENDLVLLSIFVNPTQFDNPEDLKSYPSSLDRDIELARSVGCDHIILPTEATMYPDGYSYRVSESNFSKRLCGAHRPGHFDGVLTVVLKLFNIAKAHRAYFGEKDFQQLQLIRKMKEALFLDLEIRSCATLREADGLAMSSRNRRFSAEDRMRAPLFARTIAQSLVAKRSPQETKQELEHHGFRVDYVEDLDLQNTPPAAAEIRRLAAVFLGDVRLIDNMNLETAKQLAQKD
ncbi:MAG: pantoate--beta-alanine ligase [Bdellovibrionales bacterium]|jgi:pantoate--beta-alanine ligase|nr:pantoate--beta-alanine ligase [Bdellovibrionales bacterium]